MSEESLQEILDKANTINHTGEIDITNHVAISDEDVPNYLINDCVRIVKLFEQRDDIPISLGLAYDLWNLHSERAYCSSFTSMDGVSDDVIYNNLISLISCFVYDEK